MVGLIVIHAQLGFGLRAVANTNATHIVWLECATIESGRFTQRLGGGEHCRNLVNLGIQGKPLVFDDVVGGSIDAVGTAVYGKMTGLTPFLSR